jgi:hypothetical protein
MKRTSVRLRIQGESVFKNLSSGQEISSVVDSFVDLEGELIRYFTVKFADKLHYFTEGTDLDKIKKILKAKGHVFFNSKNMEAQDEELSEDLILLDCQECNVIFLNETHRCKPIPLTIPISELLRFVDISGPDTIYVSTIKLSNGKCIQVDKDHTLL